MSEASAARGRQGFARISDTVWTGVVRGVVYEVFMIPQKVISKHFL